jgi:hypothetical protein
MDIKSFCEGIWFSGLDPETVGMSLVASPNLDVTCTHLPQGDEFKHLALHAMERMATVAIGAIINHAVRLMPSDQAFVNIGLWHGYSFLCGIEGNGEKRCIGCDNFSEFGSPALQFSRRFREATSSANHMYFLNDFRGFLRDYREWPIGVYLYDGPHKYQDQYDALVLAERHFAPGCVVIVDDFNWPQVDVATEQFVKERKGRYEFLFHSYTANNGHPTFWNGIAVLQKKE